MTKGRKSTMKPLEAIELRRNREAGATVKEAAALAGVSVATAMRVLAKLRERMGPEKFGTERPARAAGHRARAHLFAQGAKSHNPTSNTVK